MGFLTGWGLIVFPFAQGAPKRPPDFLVTCEPGKCNTNVYGQKAFIYQSFIERLRMCANTCERKIGGTGRNRTGIRGFAIHYIAILPPRLGWGVVSGRDDVISAFYGAGQGGNAMELQQNLLFLARLGCILKEMG